MGPPPGSVNIQQSVPSDSAHLQYVVASEPRYASGHGIASFVFGLMALCLLLQLVQQAALILLIPMLILALMANVFAHAAGKRIESGAEWGEGFAAAGNALAVLVYLGLTVIVFIIGPSEILSYFTFGPGGSSGKTTIVDLGG